MALRERIGQGAVAEPISNLTATYRERLLADVDVDDLAKLSPLQRRARLERVMSTILSAEGPVLTSKERSVLVQRVVDEALGLGVLEPLIADQSVTEIMVNGPSDVFVERFGRLERVPVRFASEEQLRQTIDRIVSTVNRRVDESSPMVDARLPGGERVNIIIPPLAVDGAVLTIRRFPTPFRVAELVERQSLDPHLALLLGSCVRARLNIMISGGTGSGKTTFLNALSGLIPSQERIVTIEDAAELSLQQEHTVRLESRPSNVEGRGEVTIRDLVRNSLRMRPDRIVVGEVRGAETVDMLQAMNTGHEGSLATVHANSAEDALGRLETLGSMSELGLPVETLHDQINGALDVVVHLERGIDGKRRVAEVALLLSKRREPYLLVPIFRFVAKALNADRRVEGAFEHFPVPGTVAHRLALAGEPIPAVFGIEAETRASNRIWAGE